MIPANQTNQPTTMTNPTFTISQRGAEVTFTSAFATLADAYHALALIQQRGDNRALFVNSLLESCRARRASPKQVAWVHFLASDSKATSRRPASVEGLRLGAIVTMMDNAAEGQKRNPKIVLDGVVLTRCGERSKNPGCVNITDGRPYGDNTWFGLVERAGTVRKGRDWNSAVEQKLRALAADPQRVAGQHGVATGQCCFCNRPLTTKESRSVGYGPVCADRYGLPWGTISQEIEDHNTASQIPAISVPTADDIIQADHETLLDQRDAEPAPRRNTHDDMLREMRSEWRSRNSWRINRHDGD